MKLKPWYHVIQPREDLREGKALDASEFAVHLDEVHTQKGADVYRIPARFFERTYLTRNLLDFSAEVIRRLSGIKVATSASFTMTTQFGGGKTHALTLLYHLANNGPAAEHYEGVQRIMARAEVHSIPKAKIAVFVGLRFDPRGGDDGTPLRRTPWGEIAWQLGGATAYRVFESFDQTGIAPGGDTIARLFVQINEPILILMDEVINYISRYRNTGLGSQMYNFIQNLTEEVRAHDNVVLAISLPKSTGERTSEDEADYDRIRHLLNRLSKPVIMSAESDATEIIRRRLFEWDEYTSDGRILLGAEANATCKAYADWLQQHRSQLPSEFDIDLAINELKTSYPFHPTVISVFERKWQSLSSFQRTRGVLRMLALWVSRAYFEGVNRTQKQGDLLIGLGTAPLNDSIFRQAVFGQLGENNLEIPVTTDIYGSRNAHASRLDEQASAQIRQMQLHRKVATAIFFESNGGMSQTRLPATLQEIRLAVGQPDMDIGNVEIAIEALAPPDGACFYLDTSQRGYWFSMRPNLNRVLAQCKENVSKADRDDAIHKAITDEFGQVSGINRVFFPKHSSDIPNQPALTLVVLPEQPLQDPAIVTTVVETLTREYGQSARTYKSALIWAVPENTAQLQETARTLLAWRDINDRQDTLQLSESQKTQIPEHLKSAKNRMKEAIWQSYSKVMLLGKDNQIRQINLGRHNSSSASSLTSLIERELVKYDEITGGVNPQFLVRNWPPAFKEWSTKAVKDAFFASPQFPRIKSDTVILEAIAKGVANGYLAYVSKLDDGSYVNFVYKDSTCTAATIAISDSMYLITGEVAEAYVAEQEAKCTTSVAPTQTNHPTQIHEGKGEYDASGKHEPSLLQPTALQVTPPIVPNGASSPSVQRAAISQVTWSGNIPAQKWTNFYMKVLTKFAANHDVSIKLELTINGGEGISTAKLEEMRAALHELGLDEHIATE
jgi:hypothetical protein